MSNYSLHKIPLTIILFFSQVSDVAAQEVSFKGKITNDNEYLHGATVTIGGKSKISNQQGEFIFHLKAGSYTLTITHTGYKKHEENITVNDNTAQQNNYNLKPDDKIGEVVVLGSRSEHTEFNSPVPVTRYTSTQLVQTGQVSLTQMLNLSAPSFNTSREILNEPVTLRGLDPQHVLIMLNKTRYHNMAWLFSGGLKGQLGRGSVGNDLNSIPIAAIEKIEILTDGASAQYGSDAIAGVINIELKKMTGETTIELHTGQFYKGDGAKFSFGLNHGFSLRNKGFLNLSATYRQQASTFRGDTYMGTVYYDTTGKTLPEKDSLLILDDQKVQERNFNRKSIIDNAGNAKSISTGMVINGGFSIHNSTEIFWTAAINKRQIERKTAYKFPKNRNQVNFSLFPDGFQPLSKPNTIDLSFIAGIKGETRKNWHWDISSSYGLNSVSAYLTNTNNPSQSYLGINAPTSFYTGKDSYQLLTNSINFTKILPGFPYGTKSLSLAAGAEWRYEKFTSKAGEEGSWKNYDPLHYAQGGVGSAGPENAVSEGRGVLGIYLELESALSQKFLINVAGRYEHYNDFGGSIAGKISARYKYSDKLFFRASLSNGFRAPSLQQQYMNSIQTYFFNSGGMRIPVIRGTFPNDHKIVKALSIPSLTAEKSINLSAGFSYAISKNLRIKADAYWIQIKDRIVLSGTLDRSIQAVREILDSISGLRVDVVQFFTNAIDTRTRGIDIILNGHWKISKSVLGINLAVNFNDIQLINEIRTSSKLPADTQIINSLFNIEEITRLEDGQPSEKIILSISYKIGRAMFILRNTLFGKTALAPVFRNPNRIIRENFSPKVLTDISISFSLKNWVSLTLGVNNIFDVYPDRLKNYENTSQGSWIYSPEASPFGFNGGYYYAGLSFKW